MPFSEFQYSKQEQAIINMLKDRILTQVSVLEKADPPHDLPALIRLEALCTTLHQRIVLGHKEVLLLEHDRSAHYNVGE
jgi:hypothetical protein